MPTMKPAWWRERGFFRKNQPANREQVAEHHQRPRRCELLHVGDRCFRWSRLNAAHLHQLAIIVPADRNAVLGLNLGELDRFLLGLAQ
ncbi:MAG: hypothetical protein EOP83_22315 [Verrucomicrobiaceae bacterium]|nr:MAG: hypothetical protein EOP83_22315 [Verrucomicrobiaceae bacterium]